MSATAVFTCTLPLQKPKKFRQKSATRRQARYLPASERFPEENNAFKLMFAGRSGSVVTSGACDVEEVSQALKACDMLAADWMLQGALEVRHYGMPAKMAVHIVFEDLVIVIDSGENEEMRQHVEVVQGASAVWIPVGVVAPSGCRYEVNAVSGETCSTSQEPPCAALELDGDAGDGEQPSTNWGAAGFAGISGCEEEALDYDEEDCLVEDEIMEEQGVAQLVTALASGVGRKLTT
ncbi:hypothetical protein NDU88_005568 [Pleurodeles waltl]|uniref:Uncharacterized protein n=1 Tax=Pleurodeles waltl TaxID=8319 RepID=A0AAV7NMS9_PLEWA|nr:hypothetical protein NDU88_005568 [Pleurodeles waltl]